MFVADILYLCIMKGDVKRNIIESLPQDTTFTAKDVLEAIKGKTEKLPPLTTVQWCLYDLREKNIIERVSRGVYRLSNKSQFRFVTNEQIVQIDKLIKQKYPFIRYCIWSGNSLTSLMHHIAINNAVYVEIERDVVDSVFNALKGVNDNVFINPDNALMERYVDLSQNIIIVKTLVSEAPLEKIDEIPIPSFEKVLVDICFDTDFQYLAGSELHNIIDNARQYPLDNSRLLRYASRKNKREHMQKLLTSH